MADAIVNAFKRKDWKGLGKIMADGINWGMQKLYDFINWNNVYRTSLNSPVRSPKHLTVWLIISTGI